MGKINLSFKNTMRDNLIRAEIEKHSSHSAFIKDIIWERMQMDGPKANSQRPSEIEDDGILDILK